MAGFKNVKRKVTVEREVRTVAISNNSEAAEILHDYCNLGGTLYRKKYGIQGYPGYTEAGDTEVVLLAFAAALHIVKDLLPSVKPEDMIAAGVEPFVPVLIEPTWTGSDGKTQTLRNMPTRYLQSVRRFASSMTEKDERGKPRGQGLLDAIDSELERRDEDEG
jgi:hypothetical protein